MNKYGEMAMRHWRKVAPSRYSAIEEPETFFAELGEQVQAQIANLQTMLAGQDSQDEEYLAKMGRLTAARNQAEEMTLAELVWIAPETTAEQDFEEWAASTSFRQRIVQWAFRWQDTEPEEQSQIETAEDLAAELGLPTWLLLEARDSTTPERVLDAHPETVKTAQHREWVALGRPTA